MRGNVSPHVRGMHAHTHSSSHTLVPHRLGPHLLCSIDEAQDIERGLGRGQDVTYRRGGGEGGDRGENESKSHSEHCVTLTHTHTGHKQGHRVTQSY